MVHQQTFGV